VSGFELLKLAHQAIVLGVGYERIVERIIPVIMEVKPVGQYGRPLENFAG
jgi:hypothetical protein